MYLCITHGRLEEEVNTEDETKENEETIIEQIISI